MCFTFLSLSQPQQNDMCFAFLSRKGYPKGRNGKREGRRGKEEELSPPIRWANWQCNGQWELAKHGTLYWESGQGVRFLACLLALRITHTGACW
jgi:hypothetical protein